MSILAWIILGGFAGWIASLLAGTDEQQGLLGNVVVGITGAFIGGPFFNVLGGSGITGFNPWSLLVAIIGAIILLTTIKVLYQGLARTSIGLMINLRSNNLR